eukprot:g444.t1
MAATIYAVKLWARISLPFAVYGLIVFVEFSKNNPSFPLFLLALLVVSFIFFSLQRLLRKHRVYERAEDKYKKAQRRYNNFINSIHQKSKLLAKLTPHVLFFSLALGLAVLFPNFAFTTLNDSFLIFMIGTAGPLCRSMYLVHKAQFDASMAWLKYWTVFSLFLFMRRIPLLNYYIISTQVSQYVVLMFALWMLLPATNGADWALKLLIPFVNKNIKKIPRSDRIKDANIVWRVLVAMNLISDTKRQIIDSIIKDSGSVVLLSLLFLFTPGFLTYYGCLMVGYLYPIYAAMYSLRIKQTNMCVWWLTYMIIFNMVFFALDVIEPLFSWIPLWPENHLRLLLFIWLQLPYFRGAQVLYSKIVAICDFENTTDNEALDFMSPHPRTASANDNNKKSGKHQPRQLELNSNGAGESNGKVRKRASKTQNANAEENIYKLKEEDKKEK